MGILGLPLIYIAYRYWSFLKMTPSDCAMLTSDERQKMLFNAKSSFLILAGALIFLFGLKFFLSAGEQWLLTVNAVAFFAVCAAMILDQKAEVIKRKGCVGDIKNHNKKPASVAISMVVFWLLMAAGVLMLLKNKSDDPLKFFGQLSLLGLAIVGLIGLHLRKNWGRIYISILAAVVGVVYLFVGVKNLVEKQDEFALTISFSMFCLMCWWFYSLFVGRPARKYFMVETGT